MSLYSFLLQKFTSHSKLSATVPAFVPGEAYTGPTFPSNLVINSNLSPLVPEFKPSVSLTSYAPPYKPGHHFQYLTYHRPYIKQGNIELQQVSHQDLYVKKKCPLKTGSLLLKGCMYGNVPPVQYHSHEQSITLKYSFAVMFSFLMVFSLFT